MKRIRFNIASLLVVVLVVAVSFAGLREATELWDSGLFTLTLVVLLVSILLAIHRTEKRRAYWLGFALFGWIYLGLTLVPSIESTLITTKGLACLDSKLARSIQAELGYFDYDKDGLMDLVVANNSQPNVLSLNKGNGTWQDVTAVAGLNPADDQAWSLWQRLLGTSLNGSNGTTESFVRIGHSLIALIAAMMGGVLSRQLHVKKRERSPESVAPTKLSS